MIALRDGKAVARAGVLAVGEIGRVVQVFVSASERERGLGATMLDTLRSSMTRQNVWKKPD